MAKTYVALASTVLGSPTATVTFSSISGSYTDLIVRISAASSAAVTSDPVYVKFNGSSTSFSSTFMQATSTTASSASLNQYIGEVTGASSTANTFGSYEMVIPNYANSSYNKPYYSRGTQEANSSTAYHLEVVAGLWSSTAAINAIAFNCAANFVTGSRFDLFGVLHL